MGYALRLLVAEFSQLRIVPGQPVWRPVRLSVSYQEEVHTWRVEDGCLLAVMREYHGRVSREALIEHLKSEALRLDGPFTLRSGEVSNWYLDARQTTFDGRGAWLVGQAVLDVLDSRVEAVGGMTMGADPISLATALVAANQGRPLKAFSIRKTVKDHGTGGRMVGPVRPGMKVAILEDTTTTGSAAGEATDVALEFGLDIIQAIAVVDRSEGTARSKFADRGISQLGLITPTDLGVEL